VGPASAGPSGLPSPPSLPPAAVVLMSDGGNNTGTAPANDIDLSGSPPGDWKVSFVPKKIDALGPGEKRTIEAMLTPSPKAIAGDYMTTLSASSEGASTNADFRITVATSTLWGIAGIGIIAAALLVAVGAVARYGRR
jgi:uncharacterized membrane protein